MLKGSTESSQATQNVVLQKKARRLKPAWIGVAMVALGALFALPQPARATSTKCKMTYSLSGWSAAYSTASGSGTITCDNGQSAHSSLRATGGGLTAGKSKIVNGSGTFSEVADISELFGSYASADVHAGIVDSSAAQVVTKGTVSLAFSGTGKGIDLGVTFGKFVIAKRTAKQARM
jgi:hypothetical protein